ncbi:PadR family transcriptional regulator [Staphylococcus pseudoxylosus]|uniref:PadR family transcriptional regulator n=1 Tax=Staphylococcus pseudoxylosus TaxID=2282419 RepID=A0AAQ0MGJ3_9STAP|nr:PadR family transcriptional regulator [Staphylococcus pseudoxylosus]MCE5002526.1 helix-turn-helix transcriptional regulator [Staphylococcus pseudoxylosus]RMI85525.1 PadR family transcriptional regulator [Staphylococcus pseudoxylosus]
MDSKLERRMFLGFIYIHILHHASEHPIYGNWMMEELRTHGYAMSAGTLYPLLHRMEDESLLVSEKTVVAGKQRKNYTITPFGKKMLEKSQQKLKEIVGEI